SFTGPKCCSWTSRGKASIRTEQRCSRRGSTTRSQRARRSSARRTSGSTRRATRTSSSSSGARSWRAAEGPSKPCQTPLSPKKGAERFSLMPVQPPHLAEIDPVGAREDQARDDADPRLDRGRPVVVTVDPGDREQRNGRDADADDVDPPVHAVAERE